MVRRHPGALVIPALAALLLALPLSLADYRARLQQVDEALEQRQTARAAGLAQALLDGEGVRDGELTFSPDAWTLGPIARGQPHQARLRSLLAALGQPTPSARPATHPDRALLEQLRLQLDADRLAEGGELQPLIGPQPPLLEVLASGAQAALHWIARQARRLFRWLVRLFPAESAAKAAGSGSIAPLVFCVVGLIVVLVIALAVRSHRSPPLPGQALAAEVVEADADPSSRTAAGWEERALLLGSEGRAREAIRAWYHALLVDCYGAGLLHYRPGRTNWEYAHALSPALEWRPRFEDLTRRFDREWYGRRESTADALEDFSGLARAILDQLRRRG